MKLVLLTFVEKIHLGNGKWETAKYNNRLQVTEIGLGSSSTNTGLLKLSYDYGTATENNGSMKTQTMVVPSVGANQGFTAIQNYTYDALNRIQSAEEKVSNTTTWKQTFQYDRYGNRRFDAANTTTLGSCSQVVCNPEISTATNRLVGYGFDKTGNVTLDANGNQFLYDAENHQKEVKNSANQTVGLYLYDGEGKRVKKISAQETTIFVYDGGGQLAAEYSTQSVQTPQTSYLTADHLGSPRVITNQLGAVTSRKDFAAFGDETFTAQRTQGLGYKPDEIRQDYTGYEKDDESGLEFAQARYYNSTHGRFTSIDPLMASANVKNPQTFNRYSYVLNSPYKFSDPLGLLPQSYGGGGGFCSAENSSCEQGEEITTRSQDVYRQQQQEEDKKKQQEDEKKKKKKGKKQEQKKTGEDDVIKVYSTDPQIRSINVNYIDETIYGDEVPIGGEFEIEYTFVTNAPQDGSNAADAGTLQPVTNEKNEVSKSGGTFADANKLESTAEPKITVTKNGKEEGFIVTKTERFRVIKTNQASGANYAINYQVVVNDPSGRTIRASTLDRKYYSKAVEVADAPRKKKK